MRIEVKCCRRKYEEDNVDGPLIGSEEDDAEDLGVHEDKVIGNETEVVSIFYEGPYRDAFQV